MSTYGESTFDSVRNSEEPLQQSIWDALDEDFDSFKKKILHFKGNNKSSKYLSMGSVFDEVTFTKPPPNNIPENLGTFGTNNNNPFNIDVKRQASDMNLKSIDPFDVHLKSNNPFHLDSKLGRTLPDNETRNGRDPLNTLENNNANIFQHSLAFTRTPNSSQSNCGQNKIAFHENIGETSLKSVELGPRQAEDSRISTESSTESFRINSRPFFMDTQSQEHSDTQPASWENFGTSKKRQNNSNSGIYDKSKENTAACDRSITGDSIPLASLLAHSRTPQVSAKDSLPVFAEQNSIRKEFLQSSVNIQNSLHGAHVQKTNLPSFEPNRTNSNTVCNYRETLNQQNPFQKGHFPGSTEDLGVLDELERHKASLSRKNSEIYALKMKLMEKEDTIQKLNKMLANAGDANLRKQEIDLLPMLADLRRMLEDALQYEAAIDIQVDELVRLHNQSQSSNIEKNKVFLPDGVLTSKDDVSSFFSVVCKKGIGGNDDNGCKPVRNISFKRSMSADDKDLVTDLRRLDLSVPTTEAS